MTASSIVVVGGGAGGLELVVKLARKFKRNKQVSITLVDRNPTHIWKPLLHEIATGSLNSNQDETSYRMLAKKHGFDFVLGTVDAVQTTTNTVSIAAHNDADGQPLIPPRQLEYTQLVLCVGSLCNDFGTPGVQEHALLLDSRVQAERFHQQFLNELHRVNASDNPDASISLVIVGAGATGVELAADLHNVAKALPAYGFEEFSRDKLRVVLVEAGPRILAQLPDRVSASVTRELQSIGVDVRTSTMVSEIGNGSIKTADNTEIDANLVVWAAGIRAPEWIAASGLPVDKIGRVRVSRQLIVENTGNVFALGDCCACPISGADNDGEVVPPRAQSAHQMAKALYQNIVRMHANKPAKEFHYKDFGSLISLSEFSTIGNLMGNLMRGTVFIEGWLARLFYLSLYRMHQVAIHGVFGTMLLMLNDSLYKATRAEIKLH